MAKLTRRSYKRKKIAFAAVILGGVALVSSGFAAFVLSQDKTGDGTGSIQVGEVSDGNLEMTIASQIKGNEKDATYSNGWKEGSPTPTKEQSSDFFRFDAAYGDTTGRAKWNGTDYEHLEIRYTVTIISVTDSFDKLTIKMAQNSWIDDMVDKNNIVAPACYTEEASSVDSAEEGLKIAVTKTAPDSEDKDSKYKWVAVYTVAFQWGATFDGMNPTEYYDKDYTGTEGYDYKPATSESEASGTPKGKDIDYSTMVSTIDSLFKANIDPFKITFHATAK